MATLQQANDPQAWDDFLRAQRFSPFLQSWTMGEVYREIGQEPVRLELCDGGGITGICFGHIVPARRGRHLAVPYGPVLKNLEDLPLLLEELARITRAEKCSFVRMSPFWPENAKSFLSPLRPAPMHLLGEHVWYLPLKEPDPWEPTANRQSLTARTEVSLLSAMRKTTRNLIRRAEKEGVTIKRSLDPLLDLEEFIALHDETRKRHHFTPYTNAFFRAQVAYFAPRKELTLYLAQYQGHTVATSVHMHFGGETSYHHGASSHAFSKIPASYLLQWTAIKDALKRGDGIYSFWGIAPPGSKKHPFAGVTLFKTGFGGNLINLAHCADLPLSSSYRLTRAFEILRKLKRGF